MGQHAAPYPVHRVEARAGLHASAMEVHDTGDDDVVVGTNELNLDRVAVRHRRELSGLDPQTVERRHVSGVESCVESLELGRHCQSRLGIGDLDQALAAVDVVQWARRDVAQGSLDARVQTVIVLHVRMGHCPRVDRHPHAPSPVAVTPTIASVTAERYIPASLTSSRNHAIDSQFRGAPTRRHTGGSGFRLAW